MKLKQSRIFGSGPQILYSAVNYVPFLSFICSLSLQGVCPSDYPRISPDTIDKSVLKPVVSCSFFHCLGKWCAGMELSRWESCLPPWLILFFYWADLKFNVYCIRRWFLNLLWISNFSLELPWLLDEVSHHTENIKYIVFNDGIESPGMILICWPPLRKLKASLPGHAE